MSALLRVALLFCSLLFPAAAAWADALASGHWAGTISLPAGDLAIEIDLATDASQQPIGRLSEPAQGLNGFPLANVSLQDDAVRFEVPGNGGGAFTGTLSADHRTLTGTFAGALGSLPLALTRTGDAVIAAPPVSPRISDALAGTWRGALVFGPMEMHVLLRLRNQADGTATGEFVSVDEGGIVLPVRIAERAPKVDIEVPITSASYSATLNQDGSELMGSYAQRGLTIPLTLMREQ